MLDSIINEILHLVETTGYFGIVFIMIIEGIIAPIPSEAVLPFIGYIASQGKLNLALAIIVAGIASYIGTLPFYFLGRLLGKERVNNFILKFGKFFFVSKKDLDNGVAIFEKHGTQIVFFARFIPLVRSLISIPAGIYKVDFKIYSIYTIAGSTIWCFILIFCGYLLKDSWKTIQQTVSQYEKFVIVLIAILIVYYFIRKYLKKKDR